MLKNKGDNMVVKTLAEYVNSQLSDRIHTLQDALNQAEKIIATLEKENKRLTDVLINLTSENNQGYINDRETFNEPMLTI